MRKSFRGMLADGAELEIRLSTNDGLTGYKIVKFQAMAADTAKLQQSVLKLFSVKPGAVNDDINFNDPTLMGAVYFTKNDDTKYPITESVIFDNTIVNQDMYITHKDASTGENLNYYLELEQVKLSKDEAAVATLKDMRGRE